MKRTCVQCGKEFEITASEAEFYQQKGLEIPKRCKACRAANKAEKKETAQQKKQGIPAGRAEGTASSSSSPSGGKKKIPLLLIVIVIAIAIWLFIPSHSAENETAVTGAGVNIEQNDVEADNEADIEDFTEDVSPVDAQNEVISAEENDTETQTTAEEENEKADSASASEAETIVSEQREYVFRNSKLLNQHYEKHGVEMGFASAEEYQAAASAVVNNPEALHKTEKEDGDDVYYVEATNEFVIVSSDGYLRTYFNPSAGLDYYNRQ